MTKLQRLRDALEAKPQLLADLLDLLREDPPRIARHWQPGNDKTLKTAWVRKDPMGRPIISIAQTGKEHPPRRGTWYITGSSAWPIVHKDLPFSESRQEAMRIADTFLRGREFILLDKPDLGTLDPWIALTTSSDTIWVRCHDRVPIATVKSDAVVWGHNLGPNTYIGANHAQQDADAILTDMGWTLSP